MKEYGMVIEAYMHVTHEQWEVAGHYKVPIGSILPGGNRIKIGQSVVIKDMGCLGYFIETEQRVVILKREEKDEFFTNKNNLIGWEWVLTCSLLSHYVGNEYGNNDEEDQ